MRLTLQFKFSDGKQMQLFHYEDGAGIPIPQIGDRVIQRATESENAPKVTSRTFHFSDFETAIYFKCE
jgi:hypothetical protein